LREPRGFWNRAIQGKDGQRCRRKSDALISRQYVSFVADTDQLPGNKHSIFELKSASHWCEQCLLLAQDMMLEREYFSPHNCSVESLRESSTNGCHMCQMILNRFNPDELDFYIQRHVKKKYGGLSSLVRSRQSTRLKILIVAEQHYGLVKRTRASLNAVVETESLWHTRLARCWLSEC